jgi:hypothetical protein
LIEIFHLLAAFTGVQPPFGAIARFDGWRVLSTELFIDVGKIPGERLRALCSRGNYGPGGFGQRLFPCLEFSVSGPGRQRRIPLPDGAPIGSQLFQVGWVNEKDKTIEQGTSSLGSAADKLVVGATDGDHRKKLEILSDVDIGSIDAKGSLDGGADLDDLF